VSAAYLLAGNLTLEKRDSGQQHTFHAGEAITETVGITHRGRTADQSATLIVFYAGSPGLPLSIQAY
jgi:quercetin dioxygenase-like cupin family protein